MGTLLLLLSAPVLCANREDTLELDLPVPEIGSVEQLVDQVEEEENGEILDWLLLLQENPIDLNTVTSSELGGIPGMTLDEAHAILSVRSSLGEFRSLEQIRVLENGEAIINKIRSYVTIAAKGGESRTLSVHMRTRIGRDLQMRRGFRNKSFAGSPLTAYSRVLVSTPHDVHAGVVTEKDAGERITDGFASGHLLVKNTGILSDVIVGDYTVNAGQGLVFWRGSALGKGGDVVSASRRSGTTIEPYRSADEFNFLRGLAFRTVLPVGESAVTFSGFYSTRSLDASHTDEENVSAFYASGLFRTESERRRRRTVREELLGGRLTYETQDWAVGGTLYHSAFDRPVAPSFPNEFSGRYAAAAGLDGWLYLGRVSMFGEVAFSRGGATAGIAGGSLSLGRGSRLVMSYRSYAHDFHSLHANPFSERSGAQNERGLYLGARVPLARWLRISAYVDHFRFPWQTATIPLPTGGRDQFLEADISVSRHMDVSLRYTNKVREGLVGLTDEYGRSSRVITDRVQERGRITATYRVTREVRFKWRGEVTSVRYRTGGVPERGVLVYQDIRYSPLDALSVEGRMILFHSDSFDSRVYEFENDVRGVFSNPPLFDRGRRWYVLARFDPSPTVGISIKYAETQKEGVNTISSGLTEIEGDTDNRITVQVDVRF